MITAGLGAQRLELVEAEDFYALDTLRRESPVMPRR